LGQIVAPGNSRVQNIRMMELKPVERKFRACGPGRREEYKKKDRDDDRMPDHYY
jgi:hypothetical protein